MRLRSISRIQDNDLFGFRGVCAGLAYRLKWPTWSLRMLVAGLALFYGAGLVAYALLWLLMPGPIPPPSDYAERTVDLDDFA